MLLARDQGTLLHHFRLGVKGGEINVLGRNTGKPPRLSMALLASLAAIGIIVLGVTVLACASPVMAAQSDSADGSPLARCWKQVTTRVELAPCLEKLLADARDRLAIAQSRTLREAAELDHITGYRTKNVARTQASDSHWRAYRDAECDRQAEAMSPGTGSGDVYLACHIILTNEREKRLATP